MQNYMEKPLQPNPPKQNRSANEADKCNPVQFMFQEQQFL